MSTSSAGSSSRTDNRFDDYYTEVFIKISRFVYQIFLLFLNFVCLFFSCLLKVKEIEKRDSVLTSKQQIDRLLRSGR